MEIDGRTKSQVWWGGAIKSALKGIPQGILLGIGGALLLWGLAVAFPALGLFTVFEGFLFAGTATNIALNPIGFIALNTALTIAGNFLLGGDQAVAEYKGKVDHLHNEARISQLEGREQMVEQALGAQSQSVQRILAQGPRAQGSHVAAEEIRVANTAAPKTIQ